MRRRYRYNLIKAVAGVIASAVMLSVTVAAWFIFLNKSSDSVDLASGNLDMEVWFFTGNDFNEDGVLENKTSPGVSQADFSGTIAEETAQFYNYQPSDVLKSFTSLTEGSTITYRCAVINRNDYKLNLSMWFYNLEDYFARAVQDYIIYLNNNTHVVSDNYISDYSARIMFRLEEISASIYSLGQQYQELTRNPNPSVTTTELAVARMSPYNIVSTAKYLLYTNTENGVLVDVPKYLFTLSKQEPFINDVILAGHSMCVIDFKMICAPKSEVNDSYSIYREAQINMLNLESNEVKAIDYVYHNELNLVGSDITNYSFIIPVIYVKGEQVGDEATPVTTVETTAETAAGG